MGRVNGLGRIRTGGLRCVRATSSPLDYEPASGGADAPAAIMVTLTRILAADDQTAASTSGIARVAITVRVRPLASAIDPASRSPYAVTK